MQQQGLKRPIYQEDIKKYNLRTDKEGNIKLETSGDWVRFSRQQGFNDKEYKKILDKYSYTTTTKPELLALHDQRKKGYSGVLGAKKEYTPEQMEYKDFLETEHKKSKLLLKIDPVLSKFDELKESKTFKDSVKLLKFASGYDLIKQYKPKLTDTYNKYKFQPKPNPYFSEDDRKRVAKASLIPLITASTGGMPSLYALGIAKVGIEGTKNTAN